MNTAWVDTPNGARMITLTGQAKWPFSHMEIGEVFTVDEDPIQWGLARASAGLSKHKYKTKTHRINGRFHHGTITRTA